MADQDASAQQHGGGSVYRVAGSLTITRAATTQREIDALADPVTIDLSDIDRMDTVGAWIVYRTVRDRGAKVDNRAGAARIDVADYNQQKDGDNLIITGSLHNNGTTPALNTRLTVSAVDETGNSFATVSSTPFCSLKPIAPWVFFICQASGRARPPTRSETMSIW